MNNRCTTYKELLKILQKDKSKIRVGEERRVVVIYKHIYYVYSILYIHINIYYTYIYYIYVLYRYAR